MARTYIPVEVERRVRAAARNRCGYCLSPQHLVMARLEIEHIIPIAKHGSNKEQSQLNTRTLQGQFSDAFH
jgi:5-methylcytosine-specific restriction endonuclease McrA